jgi:molybdenum cofactor cytidylyltransferase
MTSAIILAAGEAKRMRMAAGKQLLPWGKSTILETTIDSVTASNVDETLVVLGYHADAIRTKIAAKPIRTVINPDYLRGMSTSIIAGIAAADARTQAYLLVLADQPSLSYQVINRLLEAFEKHRHSIIIPTFGGRRGHPVIFAASYKPELLGLSGDVGARGIIERHGADVIEVAVCSEEILLDIDTQEDYSKYTGKAV